MTGTPGTPVGIVIEAVHLYPTTMNTYGDRGNVAALTRRADLRGLAVHWYALELGDEPPARCDLVFMGGGQDRVQHAAAADLARLRPWLAAVIDDGGVVFAVCAGLQLLGRRYVAADGSELAGLGLLDLETLAAKRGEWRLIGNVVAEVADLAGQPGQATVATAGDGDSAASRGPATAGDQSADDDGDLERGDSSAAGFTDAARPRLLVGFENHGGRTFLGAARPLGRVLLGFGNNGRDGGEGVHAGRVIATYLHGPVLPKNAWLTDHLLGLALEHARGGVLAPLSHPREDAAQREAVLVAERDARRRGHRGAIRRSQPEVAR